MKTFSAYLDIVTHPELSENEKNAWLCPEQSSYNSFHIERLSAKLFCWRESTSGLFYVGTLEELTPRINAISRRVLDRGHFEYSANALNTPLRILSQAEVDDLLADL